MNKIGSSAYFLVVSIEAPTMVTGYDPDFPTHALLTTASILSDDIDIFFTKFGSVYTFPQI